MTNGPIRKKLPDKVHSAMTTLRWSLTAPQPMHYKSVPEMRQVRNNTISSTGTTTTAATPCIDIEGTIQNLADEATASNKEVKYMAQIATALLLLGNGYLDEAHNLVLSLSWRGDLPYAYGPPVNLEDDVVQTLACYAHCLVHRMEGPHDSEFNMTGFLNSDFWAGNTMRNLDGIEALPLAQIRQGIMGLIDSEDAQHFVEKKFNGIFGEWDPRILTELCQEVVKASGAPSDGETPEGPTEHPMKEFAERAALLELKMVLAFVLAMMGFDLSLDKEEENE